MVLLNPVLQVVLDLSGTFAFALSGALLAVRKRFAIACLVVLAEITASGGGVMRDVLAGEAPVVLRAESELFAVPALLGAHFVVLEQHVRVYFSGAAACAALAAFVLRPLWLARKSDAQS